MCDFSIKDVLALARAIIEEPVEYMGSDYGSYYYCKYCNNELKDYDKFTGKWYNMQNFRHEITCPVLIAQDILTEYNK